MKKYRRLKIISISSLFIITLYIVISRYVNQGLFKDKVMDKYLDSDITKIKISRLSDYSEVVIKDRDRISKILATLSNLKIKKYKDKMEKSYDGYDLAIYEDNEIKIGLTIYDNEYITFIDLFGGRSGTFKITDNKNELDLSEFYK
ncbi:hypothetical protein [Clostridium intestinale]|uniref:Uncharacterized protein n=2 Tax=Clostridium intestinale TaxID=36845 RepID=U2PY86_9CLOT|nr:hypothetical protein [Clostridium intestinale]ERK31450.1 hypothetical protein CINTURNW_1923 [Clostridium intestinale URNW]QLY82203.1 hypothetical protein HZF06_11630 [Clostridium intestinale]